MMMRWALTRDVFSSGVVVKTIEAGQYFGPVTCSELVTWVWPCLGRLQA